jgi:hypothetical protein
MIVTSLSGLSLAVVSALRANVSAFEQYCETRCRAFQIFQTVNFRIATDHEFLISLDAHPEFDLSWGRLANTTGSVS